MDGSYYPISTWIDDFSHKMLKAAPILIQKTPRFDHISVVFRSVDPF